MRWMITGSRGQLGLCLQEVLRAMPQHKIVFAADLPEFDISDAATCERLCSAFPDGVDVLVNAAAFTSVDLCESQTELARAVNAVAPGLLAQVAKKLGARFVHISTDYVFDGAAVQPYVETAAPAPLCEYGRSKLEGEVRVFEAKRDALLVRTSSVFGPGKNFIATMLRQAALRRSGEVTAAIRVVDDQRSCPTYALDLARGIVALVEKGAHGLFHLTNSGTASWWEVARATLDRGGFSDLAIEKIKTADLDLPAKRPLFSALNCTKAASIGVVLRPWPEALAAYLASSASPLHGLGNH